MRTKYIEDQKQRIVGWMKTYAAISLADTEIERTQPNPLLIAIAKKWRRDNYREMYNQVFNQLNN